MGLKYLMLDPTQELSVCMPYANSEGRGQTEHLLSLFWDSPIRLCIIQFRWWCKRSMKVKVICRICWHISAFVVDTYVKPFFARNASNKRYIHYLWKRFSSHSRNVKADMNETIIQLMYIYKYVLWITFWTYLKHDTVNACLKGSFTKSEKWIFKLPLELLSLIRIFYFLSVQIAVDCNYVNKFRCPD